MKDNHRKCAKCNVSTAENPNLVLHRFPKPGKSNIKRMEAWSKFCFPAENWKSVEFQTKLYTSHKMLCSNHFPESAFVEDHMKQKKLHRYAIPSEASTTLMDIDVHTSQVGVQTSTQLPKTKQPGISMASNIEKETDAQTSRVDDQSSTQLPKATQTGTLMSSNIEKETDAQTSRVDVQSSTQLPKATQPGTSTSSNIGMDITTSLVEVQTSARPGTSKSPIHKLPRSSDRERRLFNKCRRNLRKILSLQKQIRKLKSKNFLDILMEEDAVKELSTDLTSSFAVILQGQLLNCKRKKRGRRWNLHQKIVSLRLYKRSPACYRLLRRLFALPCQTTLKNLLNKLPLNPGINTHLFDVLKKRTKASMPQATEYSLLFDEMSIRKNLYYNTKSDQIEGFQDHGVQHGRDSQIASHALVFMIAGIRKKIKQPVAYYLSGDHVTADRLSILIKEVLHACFEAGVNIATTVCDMDGVNRRALSLLGASVDQPYFKFGDHEVVTLHDTPHLLKCFRNLFLKYNIKCNTNAECDGKPIANIAKWSHIEQFYDLDNSNPFFVFAPALTKSHLNPNNKQKMKVKLAAQVFSHSVSAGMYAKITQGEMPTDVLATVNLIKKMDQLFDSLNADSPNLKKGKKFSRNISDKSPHLEYFDEMISFFKNCEFIGAKTRAPSLDGWVQTMVGVKRLWRNLKQRHPEIGSLSTRRLQQDALENCFGCVRSNCGSNCNPTVSQFVAALKTGIVSNLSAPSSSANCESDEAVVLDNLNSFLTCGSDLISPTTNENNDVAYSIIDDMPIDENTGEMQACAYVCGYIIKRMEITCEACSQALLSPTDSVCHLYTIFKEYYDERRLKYANVEMVESMEKSACLVYAYLKKHAHTILLKENIKSMLQKNIKFNFLDMCQDHKQNNLENITNSLFHICINRYCITKNRLFADNAARVSLKKKINILKHT